MNEKQRRAAAMGRAQKEAVDKAQAEKAAMDMGASNLEEFKGVMTRKYGNLLRAWKLGLDTDGSGKISFVEFCNAARSQGFAGNLKGLWKEMGGADDGFVELHEWAPEISALMASFMKCLKDKHGGSLIKAWKESLDTDKSGRLGKEELVEAMAKMGWDGDAARVYGLLDYDKSGFISLEEIDIKAAQAMDRGDDELGLDVEEDRGDWRNKTFAERQAGGTAAARRTEKVGRAHRLAVDAEQAAAKAKDAGAYTVQDMKDMLTRKYGNLLRAWKYGLDLDE